MTQAGERRKPLLSVVISNHNELKYIEGCLTSVLASAYEPMEVIVMDDVSTDGGPELIRQRYGQDPRLKLVVNQVNLGLDATLNAGYAASSGDYVIFMHMDGTVKPECFQELVGALEADPSIGCAQPKFLQLDRPEHLLSVGQFPDYFGYPGGPVGRGELDRGQYDTPREIFNMFAGLTIMPRRVLEEVGLWDANYVWFRDEEDMGWRIWLSGRRVMYVPTAVAYHKTNVSMPVYGVNTAFHRFKNFLANILKHYDIWHVLLFFPPALVGVLLRILFGELIIMRQPRHAWAGLRGLWWLFRHQDYLWRERRRSQRQIRKVPDRVVMRLMRRPAPWLYLRDVLFMVAVFVKRRPVESIRRSGSYPKEAARK
ncbi:MAG: glycosyltransferase family 2 protein [Chloroflexota bacterium]|nr:glycosyltransferase family 2 protein [Chloroflexota bacterium]